MKRRHYDRHETSDYDEFAKVSAPPKLYKSGMAVFRPVGGNELADCKERFLDLSTDFSRLVRGEPGQYGLAVSLVSLAEVRSKRFKHNCDTQEVIDEIYYELPSLRRRVNVQLGRVGIFGAKNTKLRPFSVAIHEDSRQQIKDERDGIIEILNEYTEGALTRNDWSYNDIPHISLGKIAMDGEIESQHKKLIGSVNEVIPETVNLNRATLHKP